MATAAAKLEPPHMSREPKPPLLTRSFMLVVSATFAYFVAVGALLPARRQLTTSSVIPPR